MYPLNISNMVTIGNSVILHGCITKDLCLLGMGTIVLDGAVVEGKALVAADSVIRPNFIAPSGKLVTGVPANIVRDLSDNEMKEFEKSAERYRKYTEIAIESLRNIKK
jgi:carbonic anhydrase/acetyltransferase-like protein (isoleucine patch superfamily)